MKALRLMLAASVLIGICLQQTMAQTPCPGGTSLNVAIIGGPSVINGGTFPTVSGGGLSFTAFHFTTVLPANVNATTLANYDTVLLNVAGGNGMSCNMNNLSTAAKAALVAWVAQGNKLIIYDSECYTQDYSWLPYPFKTSNPGAMGASGTLLNLQNDTLSSSDTTSPYYVNVACISQNTDAVGDANVMTTQDPEWKIDMTARNYYGVTGPVHTFAEYPSVSMNPNPTIARGLIIYNGLDVDYMGYYAACSPNGLEKIWLLELQQTFNPSCLVPGPSVVGIDLNPPSQGKCVGGTATVVARVHDQANNPIPNVLITFAVQSGPNTGAEATGTYVPATRASDANGEVSFTYTSNGTEGIDVIKASYTIGTQVISSTPANVIWCNPPVVTSVRAGNRGYFRLTAASNCYGAQNLQVSVRDTGSSYVYPTYPSGTILRIVKAAAPGVGPGTPSAAATIYVVGDAWGYGVDPLGCVGAGVALKPTL